MNYTKEDIQDIVDSVKDNVSEELYTEERSAPYDDVEDLLSIIEFFSTNMYSREEVKSLLNKCYFEGLNKTPAKDFDKWIEDSLNIKNDI